MSTPLVKIETVTVEIVYMDGSRETIVLRDTDLGPVKGDAKLTQEIGRIDVTTFGADGAVAIRPERYQLAAEFTAASVTFQRLDENGSIWTGPLDEMGRREVAESIRRQRADG